MADNPSNSEQSPLSIEQVLHEEAEALSSEHIRATERSAPRPGDQEAQRSRTFLNADSHQGDISADEAHRREAFYRWLNSLHRAALCCSGGGIRSATFCLGVIQALASHDVAYDPDDAAAAEPKLLPHAQSENEHAAQKVAPKNSLLGRFHYLSTVSGGGYVAYGCRRGECTIILTPSSAISPAGPKAPMWSRRKSHGCARTAII